MKPTVPSIEINHRREGTRLARQQRAFLKTDYSFQAPLGGDFGGRDGRVRVPSFLAISEDYFKKEARGNFAVEALLFGLLVITSAVPVIAAIAGLFQSVYGVL